MLWDADLGLRPWSGQRRQRWRGSPGASRRSKERRWQQAAAQGRQVESVKCWNKEETLVTTSGCVFLADRKRQEIQHSFVVLLPRFKFIE